MKLRDNFLVLVAIVVGGLVIRKIVYDYAYRKSGESYTKDFIDNNPWLMQTSAMDAYQYYSVSDTQAKFVYGPEKELSYVSTDMLANALKTQHDQILTEVQQLYMDQPHVSYENYFNGPDSSSPYWQAINQAATTE